MAYTPAEQRSVQIGNAMNVAATLAAASERDPHEYFEGIVEAVVETVLRIQAEQGLADAFPGSTFEQAPHPAETGSNVVQFQGPAQIPQAAGQGGGQLKDGSEELWRLFFESPNAFVDNRASKRNPKAADFLHGHLENAKGYKLGLWIAGQYPNPDWVQQTLRERGYVA